MVDNTDSNATGTQINFCSACGNRLGAGTGESRTLDGSKSTGSGLARFFRSDVGLSIGAYTALCGWIAHILPIVDTSTGLITGAAIGLFRKI